MNSPSPENEPSQPLILIIDDDQFTRIQLRQAMEQDGYRVVEASNGQQGLDLYSVAFESGSPPGIVLLDAVMPVLDGYSCCIQLRKLPGGSSLPILIISGYKEFVDFAFEEAGVSDYITKPINWPLLRQHVRSFLQRGNGGHLGGLPALA